MWDYRVIRSVDVADNEEYSIRKVYYDDDGNILKSAGVRPHPGVIRWTVFVRITRG